MFWLFFYEIVSCASHAACAADDERFAEGLTVYGAARLQIVNMQWVELRGGIAQLISTAVTRGTWVRAMFLGVRWLVTVSC